jgi:hypothetical protein
VLMYILYCSLALILSGVDVYVVLLPRIGIPP